jgi:hypothetical protein
MARPYARLADTRPVDERSARARPDRPVAPDVEALRVLQRSAGNLATQRFLATRERVLQREITAPRFQGDPVLAAIDQGTREFAPENAELDGKQPGVPRAVRVVQQALLDLGAPVGVTGSYDSDTSVAVGALNKGTSKTFDHVSLTRLDRGLASHRRDMLLAQTGRQDGRQIDEAERDDIDAALLPPTPRDEKTGEVRVFDPNDTVPYQRALMGELLGLVKRLSQGLSDKSQHRTKEGIEKAWSSIEKVGVEAKLAADAVFGKYRQMPPLARGTHLTDRWEEITKALEEMGGPQRIELARTVALKYLRNSVPIAQLNDKYGVSLSNPEHMSQLVQPVVDRIGEVHADGWIEMHRHQPGSASPETGKVKIQVAGTGDPDRDAWQAFATLVHEYIHTLAPGGFYDWVNTLDAERRFTLTEGITDAFTRIVLDNLAGDWAELKKSYAPGPYRGTYAAAADRAEQLIGQIGILNAYTGYFLGKVERFGVTARNDK